VVKSQPIDMVDITLSIVLRARGVYQREITG